MTSLAVIATPAWASTPTVSEVAPQSGPTAGGNAVRIYGSGFTGATAVDFGTVAATSYHVVDDSLLTAVVPAASGGSAADNTSVDVSVTTSGGTGTQTAGFYYTDATWTVSPTSGLSPGAAITTTVSGYAHSKSIVIPEFNPLQIYLEGGPSFPSGAPPYAEPLGTPPYSTDGHGNGSWNFNLPNPFTGNNGSSYDANIQCPVNQTTADYLGNSAPKNLNQPSYSGQCQLAVGQFGTGTLEIPLPYTSDLTPASPVLTTNTSTAQVGDTVTITSGSVHWNANPFFGSSTAHTNPGETALTVQICGINGVSTDCSTTVGSGAVAMTRYKTSSTTTPISATFSGATLTGSIVVGSDTLHCSTCFVQVTQSKPLSGSISATTALTVN